jgi:hypothetical protein
VGPEPVEVVLAGQEDWAWPLAAPELMGVVLADPVD